MFVLQRCKDLFLVVVFIEACRRKTMFDDDHVVQFGYKRCDMIRNVPNIKIQFSKKKVKHELIFEFKKNVDCGLILAFVRPFIENVSACNLNKSKSIGFLIKSESQSNVMCFCEVYSHHTLRQMHHSVINCVI